jgi:hypothetical protein
MAAEPAHSALLALIEPPHAARQPAQPDAQAEWLQAVADAVQRATQAELLAAGLLPDAASRIGERRVLAVAGSGAPDGLWVLQLSPTATHRALAWLPDSAGPWCHQVWIDGRAVLPPQGASLGAGALLPGHWADDRTWAVPFAPEHHPLQDWGRNVGLGVQRGLWVIGAGGDKTNRVVLPPADQRWADPRLWLHGSGSGWRVQPEPGAALVTPP